MKEQLLKNNGDGIELLIAENEKGLEYVEQLKSAARQIQANGFSFEMYEQILQAIRFVETEMCPHCQKIEQYLIPLLDRHIEGSRRWALGEHREMCKAVGVLRECVKDIEDLRIHPAIIRDLAQYSLTIAELLSRQIEKEKTALFPLVKSTLTPQECEQLRALIHSVRSSESLP